MFLCSGVLITVARESTVQGCIGRVSIRIAISSRIIMPELAESIQNLADAVRNLADIANTNVLAVENLKAPSRSLAHYQYNSQVGGIRSINRSSKVYLRMPPVPGRPPLPDELYPVNYADLSTLTEERADILMSCFGIEFKGDYKDLNIRDKIIYIACFMGLWMEDEFMEEYKDWENRQGWKKVHGVIRRRARSETVE